MFKFLLVIATIVIFCSCSDNSNITEPEPQETKTIKEQAYEYSLTIVNCFFTKDTNTFLNNLTDTLFELGDDAPDLTSEYNFNWLFSADRIYDSSYTLDDYIATYNPNLIGIDSLSNYFTPPSVTWSFDSTTFYFMGDPRKDGKQSIMTDDLINFTVTKRFGIWKVISINF